MQKGVARHQDLGTDFAPRREPGAQLAHGAAQGGGGVHRLMTRGGYEPSDEVAVADKVVVVAGAGA